MMPIGGPGQLHYSEKDRAVLAKLQAEKDARDAKLADVETMSTASTIAPVVAPSARSPSSAGPSHQKSPSTVRRIGQKLGLGRSKAEDEDEAKEARAQEIAETRKRLDGMSEEEKEKLRAEIRKRPVQQDPGVKAWAGIGAGIGS